MIRPALRIAAALAGLLAIAAGPRTLMAIPGALLMLPLCASWRAPRLEELDSLNEWVARLRTATFTCFAAAVWLYITFAASRRIPHETTQRAAALGAAFWVVGLLATFFTAYYASRRSALLRTIGES
jgi:lysylphosphatidylglycerol synthetase-like protein (DUF2156 family)